MAKVTITIEDSLTGGVKATVEPSFETLMKKLVSGTEPTSAEAYALFALRMIREESKKRRPTIVGVPRIRHH